MYGSEQSGFLQCLTKVNYLQDIAQVFQESHILRLRPVPTLVQGKLGWNRGRDVSHPGVYFSCPWRKIR